MSTSPIRVLVVDDSVVVRRLVTDVLARQDGIEVVATAPNGRIALQKIPQVSPDLVTLDVEMPEMDGIELTQTIRAHATCSTLPVVIVTSLGDADDRQRGIEAGADAYMVKQRFDQHDLLETVERLVGR